MRASEDLPLLRTRDLVHAGFSNSEAARRARLKGLHAVRDGSYVPRDVWDSFSAHERHAVLVRESSYRLGGRTVVSHASAAVLWDMPVIGGFQSTVSVTVEHCGGGRRSKYLKYHSTRRVPEPVIVDGIASTSPARTVVDLARERGFTAGLVAADAALRRGLCRHDDLVAEARNALGTPRARIAGLVAQYANPLSESPGESLSRARFLHLGVAVPTLQHPVMIGSTVIARVDYWWEDDGVVGEFDGLMKYGVGRHMSPGESAQAVADEKIREDKIREVVRGFVRWGWRDAWRIEPLAEKLVRAGLLSPSTPRNPVFL